MRLRNLRPGKFRRRRHAVRRPQKGPHDTAQLYGRISSDVHLVRELVLAGLVELVHAGAAHVELPAVIDTAQTASLVAAKPQGSAAMRTVFAQQPDATMRVAEGDQIFAQ